MALPNLSNGTRPIYAANDGGPRLLTYASSSSGATAFPSYDYTVIIIRQCTMLLASAAITAAMLKRLTALDDEVCDD